MKINVNDKKVFKSIRKIHEYALGKDIAKARIKKTHPIQLLTDSASFCFLMKIENKHANVIRKAILSTMKDISKLYEDAITQIETESDETAVKLDQGA